MCVSILYVLAESFWFADSNSSSTCLSSCARIRDKIGGAPMAPSCLPGFPTCHRATLFSRNDSGLSSFIFSSAHLSPFLARQRCALARCEAVFVFLPSVRIQLFLFFCLFFSSSSSSSRHLAGCRSSPIRETRHDSDISPEVAKGRVDHWFR